METRIDGQLGGAFHVWREPGCPRMAGWLLFLLLSPELSSDLVVTPQGSEREGGREREIVVSTLCTASHSTFLPSHSYSEASLVDISPGTLRACSH